MEIVCPSCQRYYLDNRNIEAMTLMSDPGKLIPVFSCRDCGTIFRPHDEAEECEWHEMRKKETPR